jgi:hypothetical protein
MWSRGCMQVQGMAASVWMGMWTLVRARVRVNRVLWDQPPSSAPRRFYSQTQTARGRAQRKRKRKEERGAGTWELVGMACRSMCCLRMVRVRLPWDVGQSPRLRVHALPWGDGTHAETCSLRRATRQLVCWMCVQVWRRLILTLRVRMRTGC